MHLTCETCQAATVEIDALTGETLNALDEEGRRFIHLQGRPPRAFCPDCVAKARERRGRPPETMIASSEGWMHQPYIKGTAYALIIQAVEDA